VIEEDNRLAGVGQPAERGEPLLDVGERRPVVGVDSS
jgi:hypothetical protein